MSDARRYNAVAVSLHWLMALLILAMLVMGWTMTSLPNGSPLKFQLYTWHKSVGVTVLALAALRLVWRLGHRPPDLPASMPAWEQTAAHLGHWGLYVMMFALPLTGWAIATVSPHNIPTVIYGVWLLPKLPVLADVANRQAANDLLEQIHGAGAWVLVAMLAGHVGAALRHQFLLRDPVMGRMVPRWLWSARDERKIP